MSPLSEEDICELFKYEANFLERFLDTDKVDPFLESLSQEICDITHSTENLKVASCYVVTDPSILNFNCKPMSDYNSITELLKFINSTVEGGPLNACVVNRYLQGQARCKPHADNESYVDQSTPICTFSIGAKRNIFIYRNDTVNSNGSPRLTLSITLSLENNSLYTMSPPAQQHTLHQVQPGSGVRLSMSFRRVIRSVPNNREWPYQFHTTPSVASASTPRSKTLPPVPSTQSTSAPTTPTSSVHLLQQDTNPNSHQSRSRLSSVAGKLISDLDEAVETIRNLISSLGIRECKEIVVAASSRIKKLEIEASKVDLNDFHNLVQYIPNVLEQPNGHHGISFNQVSSDVDDGESTADTMLNALDTELRSLVSPVEGSTKLKTCWLLDDPSIAPFLDAQPMASFPYISQLKGIINNHDQCVGETNSCLISLYPSGNTNTRIHSDNNAYICPETSICNFSFGDERSIAFFNSKQHSSPPIQTIVLENKSMLVMQPGTQERLKHVILPNTDSTDARLCLSYRKVVPLLPECNSGPDTTDPKSPDATVLIGTSITKRINPAKIVGKFNKATFINCSTSGDTIRHASDKIDRLYAGSGLVDHEDKPVPADLNIKNIIISVGTNDVRRKRNGVTDLYHPFLALLTKTRKLFPRANIYVQSLIPMGMEFRWTPANVLGFNALQRKCTREVTNCTYVDIFDQFLDRSEGRAARYPIRDLFYDTLHPSYKGRGIIARAFISIVRERNFDMRF